MVRLISGSSEPVVLENGARYLLWNAPFYAVLGVLLCTRYALQSLGQKVLPLFSSVIELVGKVVFVLVFIPALPTMRSSSVSPSSGASWRRIWCRSTCTTRLCSRKKQNRCAMTRLPRESRAKKSVCGEWMQTVRQGLTAPNSQSC